MARFVLSSLLLVACGGASTPTATPVASAPPVDAAVDAAPVAVEPPAPSCGPVCIGDITTDGPVNLSGLRAAIQSNVAPLAACFGGAEVRVSASMLLLRVGSAMNIQVDGGDAAVNACIARELAHTPFPYLDAQVHVTIPLSSS